MKIQINPTKLFYVNKKDRVIRMGNFPETGKVIEYEDNFLLDLFEKIKEPIEFDYLINYITERYKVPKSEAEESINYLIEEGFIISNDDLMSILSNDIYSRELLYFLMTTNINCLVKFEKIKHKKILVLGLGGIGTIAINLLARAGFDNFVIVDCDKVEKSNLIRQLLYDYSDIGKLKIEVTEEKLKLINKNIKIESLNKAIKSESELQPIVEKCGFVLCTVDKPLRIIRRVVNDLCVNLKKPVLFCGFTEHYGLIGPFVVPGKTACLRCIEKQNEIDESLDNIICVPSYGPLCNIIASIAADEIINYFLGYKDNNLEGKTLMYNMINYETKVINWKKDSECERCRQI